MLLLLLLLNGISVLFVEWRRLRWMQGNGTGCMPQASSCDKLMCACVRCHLMTRLEMIVHGMEEMAVGEINRLKGEYVPKKGFGAWTE